MLFVLLWVNGYAVSCSNDSTAHSFGTKDVGGTKMYYEVYGHGESILFIHAGIADCRMWDAQVAALSSQYEVIRCDLRGFGKTPRGAVRFSFYHDIAVLLDSLGIGKAHIVGSSYGGMVAIDYALAYPERVSSLVLCAPAVSGATPSVEVIAIDSTEESYLKKGDLTGAAGLNVRTWVDGKTGHIQYNTHGFPGRQVRTAVFLNGLTRSHYGRKRT